MRSLEAGCQTCCKIAQMVKDERLCLKIRDPCRY